jgi:hypothetical protein
MLQPPSRPGTGASRQHQILEIRGMTRLLEVLVAIAIVFVLAVVFAICLPSHRHIERTVEVSSPVRQVYDVISGFRTYPSWNALRAYDPKVQLSFKKDSPEMGAGAEVDWSSSDQRIGNGSLTVQSSPPPQQDKEVKWELLNNWMGENKEFTIDIDPSSNGKTLKITMGYDVDYGWDLVARYSGMYLEGDPATQIQYQLTALQNMLATFPNVDYKDQAVATQDVIAKPILFVSTTAKRTLDDVSDATDKAMTLLQATIKKNKLNVVGPRITITTDWGDENYDFDVALPVDHNDVQVADPVKAGQSFGGKALVTSFTGSPAQLPLMRLLLKAYAYAHGYVFDESSEGNGRFYDELTTSDPKAADDAQSFNVYLPLQIQQ